MKKIILLIILISMCNKINAYTEYKIGDKVTYNDIDFYVIKDSSSKDDIVSMLKAEPLSAKEISTYSAGTGALTHINGGMQYGPTSDYSTSYVKTTIEAWTEENIKIGLQEVRLLRIDELLNFGYEYVEEGTSKQYINTESTPIWLYNSSYMYLTMSPWNDSDSYVWCFYKNGMVAQCGVLTNYYVVRPVIVLSKTALGDKNESLIDDKDVADNSNENIDIDIQKEDNSLTVIKDNNKQESIIKVNVANTYLKQSIIVIIMGFIIAGINVFIYYKVSNKKK